MRAPDADVIGKDRHGGHDGIGKCLSGGSTLASRQLDADEQLGDRDRSDGRVVIIGNQIVDTVAVALGVDEEGRVEQ